MANLVVTSGCLPGILSGKKYAKALFCLYAVSEIRERLLFQAYVEHAAQKSPVKTAEPWLLEALVQLISMHAREHLLMAVQDDDLKEIVTDFLTFESYDADGIMRPTMPDVSSFSSMPWKQTMLDYTTNAWQIWHLCSSLKGDKIMHDTWHGMKLSSLTLKWVILVHLSCRTAELSCSFNETWLRCRDEIDRTMEEPFMKFTKSWGGKLLYCL